MNLNEHGKRNLLELQREPLKALDAFVAPAGWKMDLHKDLITRRRDYSRPSEAAADETFLRDLHSILNAWYGSRARLIIEYGDDFRLEVKKVAADLDVLCKLRVETLQDKCRCPNHATPSTGALLESSNCLDDMVTKILWDIIGNFRVSKGDARIVSGTKAIHHLLPDLLPPMDNEYTGRFFLGYGIGQGGKAVFKKLYLAIADLSQTFRENKQLMKKVGQGYNTSLPKTMDHAIIGYMSKRTSSTGTCR